MPVAVVKAALIASIPAFSPGSEWLLPIEIEPVTALADAPPPALDVGPTDGAVPDDVGAVVAAAGAQAASRLGTVARPATPAMPPSTRRRVTSGVLADVPSDERGVSVFAMVSSCDLSRSGGRSADANKHGQDQTDCRWAGPSVSSRMCETLCDLVDLWGDVTQSLASNTG